MRDVRVLEVAGSLAGAYCGRLFAACGSDVVLLEPPGGGPQRSAPPFVPGDGGGPARSVVHEHLDAHKRSVALDLADPAVDESFGWADLIISTSDGDPVGTRRLHQRIAAANPAAVHLVLSGFGLTGPYADWRTSPLVDWASGGYLYLTGEPDREPVQGGGPWASYLSGVVGGVGAQAALFEAFRTGQGQLVDVGAMEVGAAGHQWSLTMYTHTGVVKRRWGPRFGESYHPMSLYRCRDRWISIGAATRDQWENLCIALDRADLLADDDLYAPAVRFERADEIDAAFEPWLLAHDADDAVALLQEARVPASRVQTYAEVLDAEHLAARSFWAEQPELGPNARQPSAPFRIEGAPPFRPAPTLGADTASFVAELRTAGRREERPPRPSVDLSQVTVAEFTVAWAGPLAARYLADLGATVIKVEHPTSRGFGSSGKVDQVGADGGWRWGTLPDPRIRAEIFPGADPGERSWNRMGTWNKMNRGKRSLCLDAKVGEGAEVLARLLGRADVVVHNFTPRGARSLGVDHESLRRHGDRIASVAMTGYGEDGPMASHSSWGPILEAFAGFDEATGYRGEGPMRLGLAFPDVVGGVHGAFAILEALWEQACGRRGVHIDLAQLEALLSVAGPELLATSIHGVPPERRGNRSLQHAPQGVYRCLGQDRWVALTVRSDEEWRSLLALLRDDALSHLEGADVEQRRAAHDLIDERLTAWTERHSAPQAAALLQRARVPACPPFTNAELVEDEQLAVRGFLVTFDHPDAGRVTHPGVPIHFERTPVSLRPAPTLGADNVEVLQQLGYEEPAIARLQAAGIIADRPPA